MECRMENNKVICPCPFTSCSRHGICCECLHYHLKYDQLPACCFSKEIAVTQERSIEKFIEVHK